MLAPSGMQSGTGDFGYAGREVERIVGEGVKDAGGTCDLAIGCEPPVVDAAQDRVSRDGIQNLAMRGEAATLTSTQRRTIWLQLIFY